MVDENPYEKFYTNRATGKAFDLRPNSPDWDLFGKQLEADIAESDRQFGIRMRREYPEYFGTGTVQQVMDECHTPQQKATLLLRQHGEELKHEMYQYPDFRALVNELSRVSRTPRGETPDLIPNDIYRNATNHARELESRPERTANGAMNGERMTGIGMNNFITEVVNLGLAETTASRRPTRHPAASLANNPDLLAD
jgi:hypothetical protein